MENFKSILFSIVGLAILAAVGFWAFSTIEPGSVHVNNQRQKELENTNEELAKEIVVLKTKIGLLESKTTDNLVVDEVANQPVSNVKPIVVTKPVVTPVASSKNQTLISELQKLVDGNIYMKKGTQGPQVGTVQRFINVYNNTNTRVDNDYGPSLISAVTKFQKDQKITADGETGPSTYRKMIEWLKK